MFSVVIPLYNKELSVRDTIQSVLNQTFTDFEIVIINDGSTDNSLDIVKQFKDNRIRIIDKTNGGVSSTRNRGIKEAKYEWVCFLDADDLWLNNHLEELHYLVLNYGKEFNFFCTSFVRAKKWEIDNISTSINNKAIIRKPIFNFFYSSLNEGLTMWTGCVAVKRNVFDTIGGFDEDLSRGEDIEMWVKINRKFNLLYSSNITAIYKIDTENSLSRTKSNFHKSYLSKVKLYDLNGDDRLYHKKLFLDKLRYSIKVFNLSDIINIYRRW